MFKIIKKIISIQHDINYNFAVFCGFSLFSLLLATNVFASSITFTPNTATIDEYTNDNTFDISLSVDTNTAIVMFFSNGEYAYTCESVGACETNDLIINNFFYPFTLGNITALSVDTNDPNFGDCDETNISTCLASSAYIETIGTPFSFVVAQLANVFSFVDRSVSNNTGTGVSTVLVPAVSNLWPLMLIVLGILITFYVLEKIIKMFKKVQKEQKIYNSKYDDTTYDSHGNIKSIKFGTETPFFSKKISSKKQKEETNPLNWIAPEYPKKHKEKGGTIF